MTTRELLIKKIEKDAENRYDCEPNRRIGFEVGAMSLVSVLCALDECLAVMKQVEYDSGDAIHELERRALIAKEARAKLHKFLTEEK